MDVVNGVSCFNLRSMRRMAEVTATGVECFRNMCIPECGARVVT